MSLDVHVVPDFWGELIGAVALLILWQAIRRA
jgi:hypothetical protein